MLFSIATAAVFITTAIHGLPQGQQQLLSEDATSTDTIKAHAPFAYFHPNEKYYAADVKSYVKVSGPRDKDNNILEGCTLEDIGSGSSKKCLDLDHFMRDGVNIRDPTTFPALWKGSPEPQPILIIVKKTVDNVPVTDAFWFQFFGYNNGPIYNGKNFGNHNSDWEHTMIRFKNDVPERISYGAHNIGTSYSYKDVHRCSLDNKRPCLYIAEGTHANFPNVPDSGYFENNQKSGGRLGPDNVGQGIPWDLLQNLLVVKYDGKEFRTESGNTLLTWLNYQKNWGGKKDGDNCFKSDDGKDFCEYPDSPTGPVDKKLTRADMCQQGPCDNQQLTK